MPIGAERQKIYERLEGLVGNTPLYEIKNIDIPNNCRIFCKEENKNPTGSHYDRFWVEFLRYYEQTHSVHFDLPMVETSTGNSGASFAWVCRALGYTDYRVVIPKDMPDARKAQIRSYGAHIHESPEKQYVGGLIREFQNYIRELREEYHRNVMIPNHALEGDESIATMKNIANEIIDELSTRGIDRINYFVSALGNGLSTKGMGSVFKERFDKLVLVGMEPAESPTVYLRRHTDVKRPDNYGETHGLIGTGPGDTNVSFPIMESYVDKIDDFVLVEKKDWEDVSVKLADYEGKFVGHTSAACVYAALQIAEKAPRNSIIVTVFYDSAWKYLNYIDHNNS